LCIMADWGLLGLRFLSAVGGLSIEFAPSTPPRNELRGIHGLEVGRWCKHGQMRVDVYLLCVADKPGVSTEQVRTES
jgi:hypothetical protein